MDNNNSAPSGMSRSGFSVDPRFINLRPIGHGGNAVVYSATDSDCDKEVAIKKLSFSDRRGCKYALRELRLMRRLQHENVVTVYEVLGSNGFSLERGGHINMNETSSVYIVQELLHTDLYQLVQQEQLTQEHVRLFTYQLLRGLKYIHSANVLHRDLKPMNLLINVEDLVLKIADFGLARVLDDDYSHKGFLTDNVGTCWYRSPELIISPRDYTKAIDIWSVGCILAEMLTGRPLFPGAHEMDQIGLILDTVCLSDNEWNKVTQILPQSFIRRHSRVPEKPLADKFTSVDIDALDLLEKLLVFEPSLRLSAEEALAHPYLQQFSCIEDEPIVLTPFHIEHEVDDLSPKSARRIITSEMSKSIESCGTRIQISSITADILQEPAITDPGSLPQCGDITLSLSNENIHSDHDVNEADAERDKPEEGGKNDTEKENQNSLSTGLLIEDFISNSIDNRNTALSSARALPNGSPRNREYVQIDEPLLNTAGRGNIEFISSHFNQALQLENQVKNLRVVVDIPDEENLKEQISPKENKDSGTEKSKEAKELENAMLINSGNSKNVRRDKKKKKNRRNNRSNSNEEGQDFDTLYRLPTEHLTRHRNSICGKDRGVRTVEEQLRLHEELNEKRKMAEMDKEHNVGAVGGYFEMEENLIHEHGNVSPVSEHSRDSSPTNEDVNVQRRFER
ncbi:mitogen-activated protein kinase 4-like [Ruditapes philippinarum]|uniref:mitogen-activated protein kinase 4-like n=1 Tax=Ruditapes philippinarum TaxID=129788 RepID=UPI00295BBD22|nr:mitogen-activated protein kinase 4-like [Ruditapes philippinarum]